MVKSPKIRHSKASIEPVTIELGAQDVSRIPPEQPKPAGVSDAATARPADSAKPAVTDTPKAEPAASAKSEASSKTDDRADKPAAATGPASTTGAAARPTGPETSRKADGPAGKAEAKDAAGTASAFGRDAAAKPSAPPPPPGRDAPRRRGASSLLAGVIGGAIVVAAAAGAWYGGLVPTPQSTTATNAPDETEALRTELETLRGEIAELRAAPPAQGGEATGLADANARIESVSVLVEEMRAQLSQLADGASADPADQSALEDLRSALAALDERVAALPTEGGADAEALRAEMTRIEESTRSAVESAATASEAASAIGPRIDELENRLSELTARLDEQDQTPGVALAIAASALKAAIDRGTAFTTELETYAGLAPEAPELAALREMAASGVPTRAAIAAETGAVATRMIDAGRAVDPNAGVFVRLWSSAQSLVTVRPVGDVQGNDVPAVVARWETAIEAGDYERAIAEYETLPADAKAAGADFMEKVRARHSADRLVDQALAAALRA